MVLSFSTAAHIPAAPTIEKVRTSGRDPCHQKL
jgi:hypothetical protein